MIGDKIPQAMESKIPETPAKPVLRKRGKLITFLRGFFKTRPARAQLKRSGIVKERVFGCDLGEHLLNSKQDGKHLLDSLQISTLSWARTVGIPSCLTCVHARVAVPLILRHCTAVIEEHGIQDGIYRLSGVASNIIKLRYPLATVRLLSVSKKFVLISCLLCAYFWLYSVNFDIFLLFLW